MTKKTKVIVIVSFLVIFAAGTTVGLLLGQSGQTPRRRSWLASELDLTPEQREQMREIWSEPDQRSPMRRHSERRRAIREWRDETVQALLTEEQKARHDELMQEYEQKLAELNEERRKTFEEKTERTKEILTESQRKKYEELLEKGRGPRGTPGGGPAPGRGGRFGGGAPDRPGGGPGSGPFQENRKAPGAEVQDGPRGQEKSLEE